MFREKQDEPPLYKNQPPVAGSIYWEKSLFLRMKHTIIRFQSLEEMIQSEQGKQVSQECCYSYKSKVFLLCSNSYKPAISLLYSNSSKPAVFLLYPNSYKPAVFLFYPNS